MRENSLRDLALKKRQEYHRLRPEYITESPGALQADPLPNNEERSLADDRRYIAKTLIDVPKGEEKGLSCAIAWFRQQSLR